jgi:hypothetical protein
MPVEALIAILGFHIIVRAWLEDRGDIASLAFLKNDYGKFFVGAPLGIQPI